jgi:hypothetical protein
MIYARVHDQTVADDYYGAMQRIEKRLELLGAQEQTSEPSGVAERGQLLALTERLAEPELSLGARPEIAAQKHSILVGKQMAWAEPLINNDGRKLWEHPPPSPVFLRVS